MSPVIAPGRKTRPTALVLSIWLVTAVRSAERTNGFDACCHGWPSARRASTSGRRSGSPARMRRDATTMLPIEVPTIMPAMGTTARPNAGYRFRRPPESDEGERPDMAYEVPDLPYDYDALEPHIDEATMRVHHDKHHQAYVDKANAALEGTERAVVGRPEPGGAEDVGHLGGGEADQQRALQGPRARSGHPAAAGPLGGTAWGAQLPIAVAALFAAVTTAARRRALHRGRPAEPLWAWWPRLPLRRRHITIGRSPGRPLSCSATKLTVSRTTWRRRLTPLCRCR